MAKIRVPINNITVKQREKQTKLHKLRKAINQLDIYKKTLKQQNQNDKDWNNRKTQ